MQEAIKDIWENGFDDYMNRNGVSNFSFVIGGFIGTLGVALCVGVLGLGLLGAALGGGAATMAMAMNIAVPGLYAMTAGAGIWAGALVVHDVAAAAVNGAKWLFHRRGHNDEDNDANPAPDHGEVSPPKTRSGLFSRKAAKDFNSEAPVAAPKADPARCETDILLRTQPASPVLIPCAAPPL